MVLTEIIVIYSGQKIVLKTKRFAKKKCDNYHHLFSSPDLHNTPSLPLSV